MVFRHVFGEEDVEVCLSVAFVVVLPRRVSRKLLIKAHCAFIIVIVKSGFVLRSLLEPTKKILSQNVI